MASNTTETVGPTRISRLFSALLPALFIVLTIFLFQSFAVYQLNIDEFLISYPSILKTLFLPALLVLIILTIVGALLPARANKMYISILFMLGILFWLMGNLLVWHYRQFDGVHIDWAEYAWRGWIDGAIWIVLLVLAIVFNRRLSKWAGFISAILILVQLAILGFSSLQNPAIWKHGRGESTADEVKTRRAPEAIFEFSKKQNVVQILLDAFQSTLFEEIIAEDPERYNSAFEGFTFFKEATGSYPVTYMSVPSIASGIKYDNSLPMDEFLDSVLEGKTIGNLLYDNTYDVDIITLWSIFMKGRATNHYLIDKPYGATELKQRKVNAAQLLDLVAFRVVPHFLKIPIYNDQLWFFQSIFNREDESERLNYFAHKAFIYDMIENATVTREAPLYKFIHIATSHPPNVVNADCEYAGKVLKGGIKNAKTQLRCSLEHAIDLLTKLKSMGIYEESLIIIHADHGRSAGFKLANNDKSPVSKMWTIAGRAASLLIVKQPYATGPLKTSEAQVELSDIPATIASTLKIDNSFSGRPVFSVGEDELRERTFFHHNWASDSTNKDYLDNMIKFSLKGSIFDGAAWQMDSFFPSPDVSFKTKKFNFIGNKGSHHLLFGWGNELSDEGDGKGFLLNKNHVASLALALPKDKTSTISLKVVAIKPLRLTLIVDGKEVGNALINKTGVVSEHAFKIAPDKERKGVSLVQFRFFSPDTTGRTSSTGTVAFGSLTLE